MLAIEELAANKVLAVFDRAEPRDFHDLAAVTQWFSLERLCELAREKDTGFDLSHLQQALHSFRRFTVEDLRVDDAEYRHLGELVERWTVVVERMQERDRGTERGGPRVEH
jgi:predicted nucleotidyltransferase component of viral defense system